MSNSVADTQVYIYESEYRMIVAAAREFLTTETGGDLYGTFTHGEMPIIWLASGPGPKSRRNNVHFEQDSSFITAWQRRLKEVFGIQYIGSWHSHHSLGLREPSNGDREAAKTYALNHNRRKTLEIIVTHERSNETKLWPYFYPDTVRESWHRANFVLLSKVSPIRLQLDPTEEHSFSGGINWKLEQLPTSFRNQSTGNAPQGVNIDEQQIDIPAELNGEMESLGTYLEDVTPVGDMVIVRISVNQKQFLDAYIDLPKRILTQVCLIDSVKSTSRDITSVVRQSGVPLTIHQQSRVLQELLRAFPGIQRQLEVSNKQVVIENRQSSREELPKQYLPTSTSQDNKSALSIDDRIPEQEVHQSEDVRIQVEKNRSGNYDIIVAVWKSSNLALLQDTFLKLGIKKEKLQLRISEQENNALITTMMIQDVKDVNTVLKALDGIFANPQYSLSEEVKQDLNRLVHTPEEMSREGKGLFYRFLRFLSPSDNI